MGTVAMGSRLWFAGVTILWILTLSLDEIGQHVRYLAAPTGDHWFPLALAWAFLVSLPAGLVSLGMILIFPCRYK